MIVIKYSYMGNEEQIRRIIREELAGLLASDRYTFQKHIQMFDGRNIQFGRTTGTKIGTDTDQKVAFHGATPVIQAGAISAPSSPSASYDQSEAQSAVNAINSIRTVLSDKGLTA